MTTIEKIAYHLGRRDEVPNQELAAELARERDQEGIEEIAAGLNDKNPSIQSDCLKVLYEIGYLEPELISGYAQTFLSLLDSKNNRMVWGGMIAISTEEALSRMPSPSVLGAPAVWLAAQDAKSFTGKVVPSSKFGTEWP